jgi:hypothetical protein
MKTYFLFKVFLAIKVAIVSAAIYVIAKLIFQKNNFNFLEICPKDIRLTKGDV